MEPNNGGEPIRCENPFELRNFYRHFAGSRSKPLSLSPSSSSHKAIAKTSAIKRILADNKILSNDSSSSFEGILEQQLIDPIHPGIYLCSIKHLKSSGFDLIKSMRINTLVVICYCDEYGSRSNRNIQRLRLIHRTKTKFFIRIPIEARDVSSSSSSSFRSQSSLRNDDVTTKTSSPLSSSSIMINLLESFNNLLANLTKNVNRRLLIVCFDQDYELAVTFIASYLIRSKAMCLESSIRYLTVRFRFPIALIKPEWIHQLIQYYQFVRSSTMMFSTTKTPENSLIDFNFRYKSLFDLILKEKFHRFDYDPDQHRHLRMKLLDWARDFEVPLNDSRSKIYSRYICRNCSCYLFTEINLLDDRRFDAISSSFYSHRNQNHQCNSLFIEPMIWMFRYTHQNECDQRRSLRCNTIFCPRCDRMIGNYYFNGMNCSVVDRGDVCVQHPIVEIRIFRINPNMIMMQTPRLSTRLLLKKSCRFESSSRESTETDLLMESMSSTRLRFRSLSNDASDRKNLKRLKLFKINQPIETIKSSNQFSDENLKESENKSKNGEDDIVDRFDERKQFSDFNSESIIDERTSSIEKIQKLIVDGFTIRFECDGHIYNLSRNENFTIVPNTQPIEIDRNLSNKIQPNRQNGFHSSPNDSPKSDENLNELRMNISSHQSMINREDFDHQNDDNHAKIDELWHRNYHQNVFDFTRNYSTVEKRQQQLEQQTEKSFCNKNSLLKINKTVTMNGNHLIAEHNHHHHHCQPEKLKKLSNGSID
ncbi:Alpha-1 3-mannosyl-glycoprotein 2-beta-N-acetylglucosaminyltransferase [Sarcoptes scabiei]|nr:Alpha-1 3-mannosyl-glycoprotein 2-beta-N-acetylglucosaminyltransferase [Sarcoptes scabiei]